MCSSDLVVLFSTIVDARHFPDGTGWTAHWLLTPVNLALVALAGCGFAVRGAFGDRATAMRALGPAAGACFLIGTSALVYRFFDPRAGAPFDLTATIQQSMLSVWLAIAAVAFVVHGFVRRARAARWTGLVILGGVALKVLVLDMANAGTIWRVAALLAIGLLLVATSTVYSRAVRAQATNPPA